MATKNLPDGWTTTTLGELCLKPQYGWTTKASANGGRAKLLRTTDLSRGRVEWETVPYCTEEPKELGRYLLEQGDIVISRAGSVGLSALVGPCPEAVFASYLIRFRPMDGVDKKYVYQFLQSPEYWTQVSQQAAGIALKNVNAKKLAGVTLPLPPLPEQRRIVAEIEKQFTRLDASVAALKRVQANLKRYRASVLKSACEGKLVPTEAELARAEGRDYEPADQLLERILIERRARWESQEKPRGKYKEPVAPDTSNLPDLPEGWVWATVDNLIAEPLSNGRSARGAVEGFPVLRLTALQGGWINQNESKIGAWTVKEAERFLIREDDFFVSRGNGSLRLVGVGGLVGSVKAPVAYPDTMIRIRLNHSVRSTFFSQVWNSTMIRHQLEPKAKTTAGIYKINQQDLSAFAMPLPPLAEQHRIVVEVERRLSVIEQTEAAVEANIARAERLRQSILKQAFSGQLVPQDPNDEPASVLLERIKGEREASLATAKNGRQPGRRRAKPRPARQPANREAQA